MEMTGKPQHAHSVRVVNLSEGCIPPPPAGGLPERPCKGLEMTGKLQCAQNVRVVNLSEGCISFLSLWDE